MAAHMAVTAIGPDRPGIVAALTKELFDLGCNLEDATSTVLRGHFAIMLIVAVPENVSAEEIEARLQFSTEALDVIAIVRSVGEVDPTRHQATHLISVYGGDRPGIVHAVAALLAERGVGILDLNSRLVEAEEGSTYVVMLEVAGDAAGVLEDDLAALAERLGVDVTVHPIEPDVF